MNEVDRLRARMALYVCYLADAVAARAYSHVQFMQAKLCELAAQMPPAERELLEKLFAEPTKEQSNG